jgi:hypothetical protein
MFPRLVDAIVNIIYQRLRAGLNLWQHLENVYEPKVILVATKIGLERLFEDWEGGAKDTTRLQRPIALTQQRNGVVIAKMFKKMR